ncbi:uncharacterized protein LOC144100998 [Amblyomma americanum]
MPRRPSSDNCLAFLVVALALNSRFCTGCYERRDSRGQPAGSPNVRAAVASHASSRRDQLRTAEACIRRGIHPDPTPTTEAGEYVPGGASTGTTELTKRQRERLEALVSKKAPYSLAPCRHPREFPALADFPCFRKLHEDYYRRVRRTFAAERPTTSQSATREPSAHATLGSAKSRASAKSTGRL